MNTDTYTPPEHITQAQEQAHWWEGGEGFLMTATWQGDDLVISTHTVGNTDVDTQVFHEPVQAAMAPAIGYWAGELGMWAAQGDYDPDGLEEEVKGFVEFLGSGPVS